MLSVITVCAWHAVARPGGQIEVEIQIDRCMDIEIIRGGMGVEMERGRGRERCRRGEGERGEGEMEIWRSRERWREGEREKGQDRTMERGNE